jgi:hypothetical protein
MSAPEQITEEAPLELTQPSAGQETDPTLWIELALPEAEALYEWLMKPAHDGSTALDDPLVSKALGKMREATGSVRTALNLRRELNDAGLPAEHLSDEQLRDLAQRLAQTASI